MPKDNRNFTFLDICAGIGGFSLGLERAGMVCKGQVEIDEYCKKILSRHWPHVPKWGDIKTLDPACLPTVDLICGGFPCQPVSQAGKRKGKDDDRWLWPYFVQILAHKRPAWFFGENVVGIVKMELDTVLSDLESLGYETTAFNIPACAVDAPHIRKRIWILAHTDNAGRGLCEPSIYVADRENAGREKEASRLGTSSQNGGSRILAHSHGQRVPQPQGHKPEKRRWAGNGGSQGGRVLPDSAGVGRQQGRPEPAGLQRGLITPGSCGSNLYCTWLSEPGVGRVVNGLPHRVDRIKGLGNAIVPYLPEEIGRFILAAHFGEEDAQG